MMRSGFSYVKLAAVLIALAVTMVPSPGTFTAKGLPSSSSLTDADLANEMRILSKYSDDLFVYQKDVAQVEKRARLVTADLEPVQRKSDDLKGRLSELQGALREIVRKLKAANEWDDLDTDITTRITDLRDKSYFQQNSYKKLLEDSSNNLSSYGSDISTPLENLRKKLATGTPFSSDARMVNAGYEVPAPFAHVGLACIVGNLRLGLAWRLGGKESQATQNARICACSGGATCTNSTT